MKTQITQKTKKKEKHIHSEAIRITRFLQGEKREKADVVIPVEKKESKNHSIQSSLLIYHMNV